MCRKRKIFYWYFNYGTGSLHNDYVNNFKNEFSNKYEKILKTEKKTYGWWFKFYVILLLFDSPLNIVKL
jgi:hypothetical protein